MDALLDQLRAGRDELPAELRERLLDGMIDELIAGKRGEHEDLGQAGVLGEITRRMVERALAEELTRASRLSGRTGAAGRRGKLSQQLHPERRY